jgi:hypothetical protein
MSGNTSNETRTLRNLILSFRAALERGGKELQDFSGGDLSSLISALNGEIDRQTYRGQLMINRVGCEDGRTFIDVRHITSGEPYRIRYDGLAWRKGPSRTPVSWEDLCNGLDVPRAYLEGISDTYVALSKLLTEQDTRHQKELHEAVSRILRNAEKKKVYRPTYVYLIVTEDRTRAKIGISSNVKGRLSSIRTSCPEKVDLLHTTPGTIELEKFLHNKFKHLQVHNEWYEYDISLEEAFIKLNSANVEPEDDPPVE